MEQQLDKAYWDNLYNTQETRWDIGVISIPIKAYVDQLTDKSIAILIPGCGNAWEAEYLLQSGFTNITLIDISEALVQAMQARLAAAGAGKLKVICGNFFDHEGAYDLILEQTFFCALDPSLREKYVSKMYSLLKEGGKLAGVLFDRVFEGGPPFGGSRVEYEKTFSGKFHIKKLEACYNSIGPRQGTEVFMIMEKKGE